MEKPDLRMTGVYSYGPVNLNTDEHQRLWALIPTRWRSLSTQDRTGKTDADRLLLGVREALGRFDASGARRPAARSALVADLVAISKAAQSLQRAIQRADADARRAVDVEASCRMAVHDLDGPSLSVIGEFSVHWFEALRQREHLDIALALEQDGEFERRSHSILSALWDLSEDVSNLASFAAQESADGQGIRPDRFIAQQLARSIVGHAARNLKRKPPTSLWFAELVSCAGSFRGVSIGKQIALSQVRSYAVWHADQSRQKA